MAIRAPDELKMFELKEDEVQFQITFTWLSLARFFLLPILTGSSSILWLLNNFSLPRPGSTSAGRATLAP